MAETANAINIQTEIARPLADILFPDEQKSQGRVENNRTTRAYAGVTGAAMLSALEQAGLVDLAEVKQYVEERQGES